MEWESDSHWSSHTYPRQVRSFPGRLSSWELEFRDCGAIPGQGLLLTAERQIEGIWGRILWWEMSVKESQAAMEARRYCWVTHRGWSHHHSLSFPTCQNQQLNNREADSPDALNYRVGPQPGCSFKCLTRQPTEDDPTQGVPSIYDEVPNKRKGLQVRESSHSAWTRQRYRKRLGKEAFWSPDTKGSEKNSERAITTATEAMSLHTWHCQGPHKPSRCTTFKLNPHWSKAATGKKMSFI